METGEPEGGFALPKMSKHAAVKAHKWSLAWATILGLPPFFAVMELYAHGESYKGASGEVLYVEGAWEVAFMFGVGAGALIGAIVFVVARELYARKELRSNPYCQEIKDARKLRKRLQKHKGELARKQIAALDEHLSWMIRYADHEQEELGNFAVDTMLPDLESLTRHIHRRRLGQDQAHRESRELLA